MQKNGNLYHYPLVLDTKKGGLSLLFIYIKYNAICLILLVPNALCCKGLMPYSASA